MSYSVLHIDDAERIPTQGFWWRPLRKALGTTGFGVNGYTADAGAEVIETHDETSQGAAGHEELYVVLTGAATFTVDGDEVAAPTGTLLVVPPGTSRGATAAEDGTTVLVIGGEPGAAGPRTPFEYWYEAEPHYRSGDYAHAVAVASAGLKDWPDHPSLRYQLACYEALQGNRDAAIEHLKIAYANNPDTREWAAGDDDLASVRDDPALA
ncbi:MAG TPA: cupin domain-containing protein [Solirubrobacteraceae bacterium]|nr:cupin domain-containing protein [Solirubrobacteraceae bacterium]